MAANRSDSLTTAELYDLDHACELIDRAFGTCPYLVGTAGSGGAYRDVDVRLILDDEDFDRIFGEHRLHLWELLTLAIGDHLRQRVKLPIDFQIQRQTEANARHGGKARNPLGLGRTLAAGGDGTPKWTSPKTEWD